MPPRGRLPPRRTTRTFRSGHTSTTSRLRIVNGAWNALFETDLEDLSFKTLATGHRRNGPGVYHYYRSFSALARELA